MIERMIPLQAPDHPPLSFFVGGFACARGACPPCSAPPLTPFIESVGRKCEGGPLSPFGPCSILSSYSHRINPAKVFYVLR